MPEHDRDRRPGPQSPEPLDSDVDLGDRAERAEAIGREWDLLGAIAIGGVIGAEARFGLARAMPHSLGAFPWSTVAINSSGCALIGVLMALLNQRPRPPRLARPFLGVGILGGYTTFSTFAVDVQQLLLAHRALVALGYIATTVLTGAVAVWATSEMIGRRTKPR